MAVHVDIPVFEGRLDVLLSLVTDHKVDIFDIPIASIVDAFLADMAVADRFDIDTASELLVVAAVLVELKSKRLLPVPEEVESDEELAGTSERDRLLARLLELHAYSAGAEGFALMIERQARSVPRSAGLDEPFRDLAPDLLGGVTPDDLARAAVRALSPRPVPMVDLSHVTVEPVTVSEAVAELELRLPLRGISTFRELTEHCATRMEIIVRFLAILELCKRGWVELDQGRNFGELHVRWVATGSVLSAVGAPGSFEEYDG